MDKKNSNEYDPKIVLYHILQNLDTEINRTRAYDILEQLLQISYSYKNIDISCNKTKTNKILL